MSVLRHFRGGPMAGEVRCYSPEDRILVIERAKAGVQADPDQPIAFDRGEYHLREASSTFVWQGWKP